MKNNRLLYILLVFLVAMNGFFLYTFLGNNKEKKRFGPEQTQVFIAKELGFDESQMEQFKEINREHHKTMRHLSHDIRRLKNDLFHILSENPGNDEHIDSITSIIGAKQKEKEMEVFYHFRSIHDLCNDSQRERFERIVIDALRKGGAGELRPRPPHERGGGHGPPPGH